MNYTNSPIQQITFNNQEIFVKRDDLLHKDFSGNKARKFYYFLKNDFKDIKKVVSYGSCQSNAMYSLSCLCKIRNWDFEYYVDHIPSYLKDKPIGNYKGALDNGMCIIEKELEKEIPSKFEEDTIFIPEGGALQEAQYGIKILADEIISWSKETKQKDLKVFLPSGTGTTALYLQKYLPFEVLTCACVGDSEYLKKQFNLLERNNHPTILEMEKKYHFGKLYKEFYEINKQLNKQTNIEFDLLYDSLGWLCVNKHLNTKKYNILYIHQGGLLGNISMRERYNYKYDKIQ
ncbi:1-aminocyclopropane-1-carboxylate deaminase/D-cysteine desulfhydrase [Arcobacter peruensis]|uniref:1-aminocyclopropane-1-carboxylate deaminase/D-cysteine desulfhydrase n=1 Tax=Arcobacter peruensis TaxID=2320140 RepID=UPI000F084BCC|nr:1-aminocyclopropane-1-carboxylate deaminase/D-cysteine desulfhydrase [Arcobacter peruensis]